MNDLLDYASYLFKTIGKPVDLQKITQKEIDKWKQSKNSKNNISHDKAKNEK